MALLAVLDADARIVGILCRLFIIFAEGLDHTSLLSDAETNFPRRQLMDSLSRVLRFTEFGRRPNRRVGQETLVQNTLPIVLYPGIASCVQP